MKRRQSIINWINSLITPARWHYFALYQWITDTQRVENRSKDGRHQRGQLQRKSFTSNRLEGGFFKALCHKFFICIWLWGRWGKGKASRGANQKLLHKPGLSEPKDRENKRGRELTEREKQDYYLQERNKERLIPQPCLDVTGLFTLSKPGQSRSCDLWDGDSKPRGGSCYSCPVKRERKWLPDALSEML